ncbi:DUF6538 domain-containing protein [Solemya velesiana gill symbiont]|uniref:DUF6538 domain-containing protein n=1 Tax=Solemya velesiana gill symbiont TaxID=1918948 RepID=A0A1T2KPI5_9GAMM|nr:DUF6538 domain-containing protein [Solemya velesiana gill symbiont]OOZ34773.1 hypothetical protein BOW51_11840 [Solemya velesiana gill symbiont]
MSVKLPSYLQRNRFGVFHFRRVIPNDLRSIVGKREFQRTLRTHETIKAIPMARILALQTDQWFAELRMRKTKKSYPKPDCCTVKFSGPELCVEKEFKPEDFAAMSAAGMSPEEISSLVNANPLLPNQAPVFTPVPKQSQPQGTALSALIKRYNDNRIAKKGGKWRIPKGDKAKQRRLIEIFGDIDITLVEPEDAENVREKIMLLPANPATFRGQTVEQILNTKHEETLSVKTIKDHIDHYSVIFDWATTKRLYKEANPFTDVAPVDDRTKHELNRPGFVGGSTS